MNVPDPANKFTSESVQIFITFAIWFFPPPNKGHFCLLNSGKAKGRDHMT